MRSSIALAFVLVVFVAGFAGWSAAHENHVHKRLFGTVDAVSADRLHLKDRDGKDVEVAITRTTRVLRGTAPATLADVKAGNRVVVGVSSEEPPYTAVEIRLAERK